MLDILPVTKRRPGRPSLLTSDKELARALACNRYRDSFGASESEAAEQFGVTPRTVRRWRRALREKSD